MELNELQQKLVDLIPEMEKNYRSKEQIKAEMEGMGKDFILHELEGAMFILAQLNNQKVDYELEAIETQNRSKNYKNFEAKHAAIKVNEAMRQAERCRLQLVREQAEAEILLEIYNE